jgi:hypothetical protein
MWSAVALASALLAFQNAESTPLRLFEQACLATSGDRSAFVQVMTDVGGEVDVAPKTWFERAETVAAFTLEEVSVQLETFAAVNEWVDAPPTGDDLQTFLRTGTDPRRSIPKVLRTTPASSVCMVRFDQGEGDLKPELERVLIDGRTLSEIGGALDFQTYMWRVDGPRLRHVQYNRADPQRDLPGTRSIISASFRSP